MSEIPERRGVLQNDGLFEDHSVNTTESWRVVELCPQSLQKAMELCLTVPGYRACVLLQTNGERDQFIKSFTEQLASNDGVDTLGFIVDSVFSKIRFGRSSEIAVMARYNHPSGERFDTILCGQGIDLDVLERFASHLKNDKHGGETPKAFVRDRDEPESAESVDAMDKWLKQFPVRTD